MATLTNSIRDSAASSRHHAAMTFWKAEVVYWGEEAPPLSRCSSGTESKDDVHGGARGLVFALFTGHKLRRYCAAEGSRVCGGAEAWSCSVGPKETFPLPRVSERTKSQDRACCVLQPERWVLKLRDITGINRHYITARTVSVKAPYNCKCLYRTTHWCNA